MLALDTKNFREQLRAAIRSGFVSRQCSQLLRVADIWRQTVTSVLTLQLQCRQMGFTRGRLLLSGVEGKASVWSCILEGVVLPTAPAKGSASHRGSVIVY